MEKRSEIRIIWSERGEKGRERRVSKGSNYLTILVIEAREWNRQEKRREGKKVGAGGLGSLFITALHFVPRVKIIRGSDGALAVLSMEFRFLGGNV